LLSFREGREGGREDLITTSKMKLFFVGNGIDFSHDFYLFFP
jgi:hypothetical protein